MPISVAIGYLGGILRFQPGGPLLDSASWAILALLLALFILMEIFRAWLKDFERIIAMPLLLRWGLSYALLFVLLWMGDFASSQPFLYQQF
jgi:hypothetical protein